jgi:SAM-dependent methyltransferase
MSEQGQASDSPEEFTAALPSRGLSARQAEWLRDARARLLRRAAIIRRRHVVELGAGWGIVAEELARRSGGRVTAVDCNPAAVAQANQHPAATAAATGGACVEWLLARAQQLPLAEDCCDLVFSQFAFLWFTDPRRVVSEVCRVLEPSGAAALIEPDFGGLVEYPPEMALKSVWISALQRAGGDPLVGRKLPGLLSEAGLSVEVQLPDRLKPPDPARFDLLAELPLTADEQSTLQQARAAAERAGPRAVAHLPLLMIYAEIDRRSSGMQTRL